MMYSAICADQRDVGVEVRAEDPVDLRIVRGEGGEHRLDRRGGRAGAKSRIGGDSVGGDQHGRIPPLDIAGGVAGDCNRCP